MRLAIKPIKTANEAEQLRELRNTVRSFMTHDQDLITEKRQQTWYQETYKPQNADAKLFAFLGTLASEVVAYGIISCRDGEYNLSGGIREGHRGQGLGKEIFSFITDYTLENLADTVYLDVFEDNSPALSLYLDLGFIETGRADGVIKMEKH